MKYQNIFCMVKFTLLYGDSKNLKHTDFGLGYTILYFLLAKKSVISSSCISGGQASGTHLW